MDEPLSVTLSALQHFVYCPRQCALIHVERLWTENQSTAEGRILHLNVDHELRPTRGKVRYAQALELASETYHIHGVADLVEIHESNGHIEKVLPVEFKRGKPKTHIADIVQVCAQALCLEEMLNLTVPSLCLFYAKTKRRLEVEFTDELRQKTTEIITQTRALITSGTLPPPHYKNECKACSLYDDCLPHCPPSLQSKRDRLFASINDL